MNKSRSIKCAMSILVLSLLIGCGDIYDTPEEVYVIKKGEHKSRINGSILGNGIRPLKSSSFRFTVRFDSTAIYDIGLSDQGDVNRLFGFSDCNSFHQKNSARIGWAYDLDSQNVNLFAYVYRDSERIIKKIQEIKIGSTYLCVLRLNEDDYEITVANNETVVIPRGNTCDVGLYYLLYPYFGGNQSAPHDIKIYIKELYD